MDKIGILIISYGSRALAMVDAISRSEKYDVEFYAACKQRDPYLAKAAKAQVVIPNLAVNEISKFAQKHKEHLDFGMVGPEGPIISGIADELEGTLGIPMICPTKEFALEESKVQQRLLMNEVVPHANPKFKVFDPNNYSNEAELLTEFKAWIKELGGVSQSVIKPDKPGFGKGVGVGGEHYDTIEDAWTHFLSLYGSQSKEQVIIEERIDGEEFSLQFFSDGKTLLPTPAVRDYKRAFDGDIGPNTGGMGSYKGTGYLLPFMEQKDLDNGIQIGNAIFKKLRGDNGNPGLKGIPFYMAYICTNDGIRVLEINSRPGDPEIQNLLPILDDDFVDTCYSMINGSLKNLRFKSQATVVTYAVPLTYGDYRLKFSGPTIIDLHDAYRLSEDYGGRMRIYPGSMELRDDNLVYALGSRTVCVVGIDDSIQTAREISLNGIRSIDGPLRNREDIASNEHITKSIAKIKQLRGH